MGDQIKSKRSWIPIHLDKEWQNLLQKRRDDQKDTNKKYRWSTFFIKYYLHLYNSLSLYSTIVLICNILASNSNFNNFGFNWAITIIIFIAYFQILIRSYNNITLSRLSIHKHNQQNMLIQHFIHTTKLHYMKKKSDAIYNIE